MTNKIEMLLKVLNDRDIGALPSNTVKNPKLDVNVISSVSSPSSCPQHYSVNATSTCFKQTQVPKKDQDTTPTQNLEEEFKELHLERPVIDVLTRAPYYSQWRSF